MKPCETCSTKTTTCGGCGLEYVMVPQTQLDGWKTEVERVRALVAEDLRKARVEIERLRDTLILHGGLICTCPGPGRMLQPIEAHDATCGVAVVDRLLKGGSA